MSEKDAGNRLRVLVKAVSDDLWIAIATFEVYAPSAFDAALIDKVNEREVYPAFNVISEALEATTISRLCRIWDRTTDAARIAEIEKLLRRQPDLVGDSGALRRWSSGCRDGREVRRASGPPRDLGTCASPILTILTGSIFAC